MVASGDREHRPNRVLLSAGAQETRVGCSAETWLLRESETRGGVQLASHDGWIVGEGY